VAVLLSLAQGWVSTRVPAPPPLPSRRLELRGTTIAPGARDLALVGLAALAAIPATRRLGRVLVGAAVAAAGAGIVVLLVRVLADPAAAVRRTRSPIASDLSGHVGLGWWPYVGVAGGLALAAAGLAVAVRGRRWAALSARYDAPSAPAVGERSLWEALDRGEDPTTGAEKAAD
jgi:uncharacterized membrane protein (TIGR02234 family)